MNADAITWPDNKILMCDLWPKWKPTPAEAALLNKRWGDLHQDKLRICIENNRMVRNQIPDISAIQAEYERITQTQYNQVAANGEIQRTREVLKSCQPPTAEEYADWERWAEEVLSTATPAELAAVPERLGINPNTKRVLAVAVNWCRENPER